MLHALKFHDFCLLCVSVSETPQTNVGCVWRRWAVGLVGVSPPGCASICSWASEEQRLTLHQSAWRLVSVSTTNPRWHLVDIVLSSKTAFYCAAITTLHSFFFTCLILCSTCLFYNSFVCSSCLSSIHLHFCWFLIHVLSKHLIVSILIVLTW